MRHFEPNLTVIIRPETAFPGRPQSVSGRLTGWGYPVYTSKNTGLWA